MLQNVLNVIHMCTGMAQHVNGVFYKLTNVGGIIASYRFGQLIPYAGFGRCIKY